VFVVPQGWQTDSAIAIEKRVPFNPN